MARSGVAVVLCLFVAASALSVAAPGASNVPVRATGVPAGAETATVGTATGPGLDDCSTETAVGDVAADGPVLTVVPFESRVVPGEQGVVLVCVVNPSENDETLDFSLVVEHDHDPRDVSLLLVGPGVGPGGEPTQQVLPLDRRIEDGHGRFVSPGPLAPGTGAQYAVVVAAGAPKGDYEFDVAVVWGPLRVEDESVLHVAGVRCGWFCGVGQRIDGAVAVLAAGVLYLRTHPRAFIAFLALLVGVASATVRLLGSEWWRRQLFGPGDDESGER